MKAEKRWVYGVRDLPILSLLMFNSKYMGTCNYLTLLSAKIGPAGHPKYSDYKGVVKWMRRTKEAVS